MAGRGIKMERICTSSSTSSYPIEKVRYFSYSYLDNVEIFRQNEGKFNQYPQRHIYFSSPIYNYVFEQYEIKIYLQKIFSIKRHVISFCILHTI